MEGGGVRSSGEYPRGQCIKGSGSGAVTGSIQGKEATYHLIGAIVSIIMRNLKGPVVKGWEDVT